MSATPASPPENAARLMQSPLVEVTKQQVLQHFGGSTARAARSMFITPSAVSMWPDEGALSATMRDRFQAALWREMQEVVLRTMPQRDATAA